MVVTLRLDSLGVEDFGNCLDPIAGEIQVKDAADNGGYPDMKMIPAIANYFGITIDELFGYQNDREIKIYMIINKIKSYGIQARSDVEW